MAYTDFLKPLGALNPLAVLGAIQPKPAGSEPLNPDALAIQQSQQGRQARAISAATRNVAPIPIQPQPTQTALGGSGGLTGGVRTAAPVAQPIPQPVNPATAQLQQEAANLAKYGTAIAPTQEQDTFDYQGSVYRTNPDGSATLVSGSGPQTLSRGQAQAPAQPTAPTSISPAQVPAGWDAETYANFKRANPNLEPNAEDTFRMLNAGTPWEESYGKIGAGALEGEVIGKPPKFVDTYRNIYDQLGLGDVRSQIESSGIQLQELQDKKVDEISQINENPWLTEGQRQDRTNAINKKYEQKEANLINRIQLFQSTFEQGRQEAQFVASQTAQEQQFQTERMDKQLEAERKLKEAGQEILKLEDARALGLPYGTTVAEARKLGITPKAEQELGAGIVGEYQFYQQQEIAAGREPLSFDEYQTRDANRKIRAAAGAGGGAGNLDKLLTVEEAMKLGVPYGTTKGEAIGRFASGSSGEAAKLQGIVNTLPGEISQLRTILQGASRTKIAQILSGLDPATNRLIDQVADKVGRLRSGGAINRDEEIRFKGQILRKSDLLSGNTASAISALDGIGEEARQVAQGIRATGTSPTTQSGSTSSGLGYTIVP